MVCSREALLSAAPNRILRIISERESRIRLRKEKEEVSCFCFHTSVGYVFMKLPTQREAKEKKEVCFFMRDNSRQMDY